MRTHWLDDGVLVGSFPLCEEEHVREQKHMYHHLWGSEVRGHLLVTCSIMQLHTQPFPEFAYYTSLELNHRSEVT